MGARDCSQTIALEVGVGILEARVIILEAGAIIPPAEATSSGAQARARDQLYIGGLCRRPGV